MLSYLLITAFLLVPQNPEQTGMIAGTVIAPPQDVSYPVQVILLSPRYVDLWSSEVQKRLDSYWQRYLPTFKDRKERFAEFSKQAHRDATNYVMARMQLDGGSKVYQYLRETSADGKFEFKDIPFGEYKVLAFGRVGNQDAVWQEFIDVHSPIPHFLELKKRIP
jgi:hypothetical protein